MPRLCGRSDGDVCGPPALNLRFFFGFDPLPYSDVKSGIRVKSEDAVVPTGTPLANYLLEMSTHNLEAVS